MIGSAGARAAMAAAAVAALLGPAASPAAAQSPSAPWAEVHAGSELERYLRALQLTGAADPYPWSLRAFSPLELERVAARDTAAHPWSGRYELGAASAARDGLRPAAPRAAAVANSGFPYGVNDGAVWAGRGVTLAASGGASYRRGPLSASLQPVAFVAQNAGFPLAPTGGDGRRAFADPRGSIDRPQRFGPDPYGRVEPGESWIRLDWPWIAAGVSTAGMTWGPAERFPLTLGTNAPGFPHLFVGTGTPRDIWIGELHGRLVWGRLEESEWARASEFSGSRFAPSAVAVFEPAWPEGLEVGGTRFFHLPWRDGGPTASDFLRPFEGVTKRAIDLEGDFDAATTENQLASVFFRWAFPAGGLEVYGELYREDHALDARDLVVEPDHDLATTLGLRKAWGRSEEGLYVLQAEVLDSKITHLDRVRSQITPYPHGRLRQGHTHRGRILGSLAAFGGEGLSVRLDRYRASGRWSLRMERVLRREARNDASLDAGNARDVLYALGAEGLLFRGRWEASAEVTGVWNLNRNLGDDDLNLRLGLAGRWRLR